MKSPQENCDGHFHSVLSMSYEPNDHLEKEKMNQ